MIDWLPTISREALLGASAGVALGVLCVFAIRRGLRRRRSLWVDDLVSRGRYQPAIDYLMHHRRYGEAAAVEAKRGQIDRAVSLYERVGDTKAAAAVYLSSDEWKMAALTLRKGGLVVEAAALYGAHSEHWQAAELFEESGTDDAAARAWIEAGALDRALEAATRAQAADLMSECQARIATARGAHEEAAELWEALGASRQAAEAWRLAKKPLRAARLLREAGDLAAAAECLVQGQVFEEASTVFLELGKCGEAGDAAFKAGAFIRAAELYEQAEMHREAAMALYRAGEINRCIAHLEMIEDYPTIGRVYLCYGLIDQARRVLVDVPVDAPNFLASRELLAELERAEDRQAAAYDAYREIAHVASRAPRRDAVALRAFRAMVAMDVERGRGKQVVATLDRVQALDLMTPDLEEIARYLTGDEPTIVVGESGRLEDQDLARMGTRLNVPRHERYEVLSKISEGANGAIYRAHDTVLDRDVALKMITNSVLPDDMARRWFLREAQLSASLNHGNIVTIFDVGQIDDQPFLAMELVLGGNLKEAIEPKMPLDIDAVRPILQQLTDAVSYAHSKGVVHRDIKLSNVMITAEGTIKLLDFGLAMAMRRAGQSVIIAGTPHYMSPEQSLGQDTDHLTDIYALGVLTYKLITGSYPYAHGNILEQHRTSPVPDPRVLVAELPPHVTDVVGRAMAKHKEDRFPDAVSFASALLNPSP